MTRLMTHLTHSFATPVHAHSPARALVRVWHLFVATLIALATLACSAAFAAEGDPQPVPKLEKRVTDLTATLSNEEKAALEAKLAVFEREKGSQIAVLLVGTTQPEAIFDYAMRVVGAWKLGRKGVDDGVLLLIAKNDRKMQILAAPGVQGALPDATSKRIIAEVIGPRFRAGDFAGGVNQGVDKIIGVLQGEALPPPVQKRAAVKSSNLETFLMVAFVAAFFVGPLLRSLLGRFLGATATGGVTGAAAWWVAGGMAFPIIAGVIIFVIVLMMGAMNFSSGRRGGNWGGSWGGGSSGGWGGGSSDSFSGGGGGFDGGGASGDW